MDGVKLEVMCSGGKVCGLRCVCVKQHKRHIEQNVTENRIRPVCLWCG